MITDKRARASDHRRGWSLIRGSLKQWDDAPELRRIEIANHTVDELGDAYALLERFRYNRDKPEFERTDRLYVLRTIEVRQLNLLDSIRATSQIGRPAASGILLRAMYESYLYIVLMASDTGPIIRSHMYDPKYPNRHPTPEDLADRYLEFGNFTLDEINLMTGMNTDPRYETVSKAPAHLADLKYQFSKGSKNWFPHRGIPTIVNHLWPPGGSARFSHRDGPSDRDEWKTYFNFCYRLTSHDAHGSCASFGLNERRLCEDVHPASRIWMFQHLMFAINIARWSVAAVADTDGSWAEWAKAYASSVQTMVTE